MRTTLLVLCTLALSCSPTPSSSSGTHRAKRGHGPEDVPAEGSGKALPKGHPAGMPGTGAPSDSAHGGPAEPAGPALAWEAPEGWRSVPPASSMRKAEWALPKVEGDSEDATLVVFQFGPNGGGTVQANLDRWYGMFEQPDGRNTAEVARVENRTVADLRVTITDVSGTYHGGMPGGAPAPPSQNFRMLAAIAETPAGPSFFKLIGPKNTVEHWHASFDTFVGTFHMANAAQ
jgi:hypothetical protein